MPNPSRSCLRWSAAACVLSLGGLLADAQDTAVIFNEIHYHPGPGSNAVEFVELRNLLAVDVDLSNWRLAGEVQFDFPEGVVIPAHGHRVVAASPATLQSLTGYAQALGPWQGQLGNEGGRLRLYNNNRGFRTRPNASSPSPAAETWNVDIQGDGNGGAFGQVTPTTKTGPMPLSGLGEVWNAFTVRGHAATSLNPSLALVDDAGSASPVTFALQGSVSGFSYTPAGGAGGAEAVTRDYLFLNAGNSAAQITWTLSGLDPLRRYRLWAYGGSSRDVRLTVDHDGDGDLADETPANAGAAGHAFSGLQPSPAGVIAGHAQAGSTSEGNWAGFQLQSEPESPPPHETGQVQASQERRRLMDEVDYDNANGWPVGPDGSGFTLARRDPHAPVRGPEAWTWSHARHGTPGAPNFALTARDAQVTPATVLDSSGQGAHGTASRVRRTTGGGGHSGEALYFDGSASVDLPVDLSPALRPQVSLGAWVKLETFRSPTRHTLISSDNGGYDRGLSVDSRLGGTETGTARYAAFAGASSGVLGGAPASAADGWVFVCAVFDQPANLTRLHVADTITTTNHTHNASRTTLRLGAHATVDEWLRGWLDTVFVLNRALTPAEVEQVRTEGTAALLSPAFAPDLLALIEGEDPALASAPPTPPTPALVFNECGGADDAVIALELLNRSAGELDLAAWRVLSSAARPPFVFTNGWLAAGARLLLDEADLGYRPLADERLFLFPPDGQTLADAVRLANTPRARLPDGTGAWVRPPAPSLGTANPDPPPSPVVIHEIFYRDTPGGGQEWLELHNPGTVAADLSGWRLAGGITYPFSPGQNVPAGGFLVVARDPAALLALWPGRPILGPYSGALANEGEEIRLEDAGGVIRQSVTYGPEHPWPEEADGGGASLELRDPRADPHAPESWAASDTTAAGAWQTFTTRGVATDDGIGNDAFHELQLGLLDGGSFWIDDVRVVADPDGAAISFLPNGDFSSDVPGAPAAHWRAIGTHGAHGLTRVVEDPDQPGNPCLLVVASGPTDDTHNKLETTFLAGHTVQLGQTYEISFRARWRSGSPRLNSRLYFNHLQATQVLSTGTARGTPGAANSRAVANAGPVCREVAHHPVAPGGGQPFAVRARLLDPDAVATATLHYAVNGGGPVPLPMTETPDGWSAEVPGQAPGALVQFWIEAVDGLGATATWPARGADGGAFVGVSDAREDRARDIHNLRLLMRPDRRDQLFENTERMSNHLWPATLVENGRIVYYDIGVRLKASAFGRYNPGTYGYHLRFSPGRLFRGVHPSLTFDRDSSFRELLAKHLLNRAGGGYWSAYEDVVRLANPVDAQSGTALLSAARTSSRFLESLFGPDAPGTLFNHELLYQPNGTVDGQPDSLKLNNPYNHTRGAYPLQDRGPDPEAYRWGWQIVGGRRSDDYASLVRLNRAFALSGAAFDAEIEATVDVDQWLRTWAMLSLNGNDDVYGRLWAHNWRLSPRPEDGRLIALPWDLDRAFQLATTAPLLPTGELALLITPPARLRAFQGHLLDIIDSAANATHLTPWATHYGVKLGVSLAPHVNWVQARANFVRAQLPVAIPFAITTHGGEDFATADSPVTLEGKGWIDVATLERTGSGFALPLTWTSGEDWRTEVPITPGFQTVELLARNRAGVEVGRASIGITGTGDVVPATAAHLAVSALHYHPQDPSVAESGVGYSDADDFQYLEVLNLGPETVDLSGVRFTQGITYAFPVGHQLAAGARAVVTRNPDAFALRHPGFAPAERLGPWSGRLARNGETLTLVGADDAPLRSFAYDDAFPWPSVPDGGGPSLVLMRPAASDAHHADGRHWRASVERHGSPGVSDRLPFAGDPDADPDGNGWPAWAEYALSRTGEASPLALQSVPDGSLRLIFLRNPGADADVRLEAAAALPHWQPLPEAVRTSQVWTEGGNLWEEWTLPAPSQARRYFRLNIAPPP